MGEFSNLNLTLDFIIWKCPPPPSRIGTSHGEAKLRCVPRGYRLVSFHVVCERLSVMHELAKVVEILVQILQDATLDRIPPYPKMKSCQNFRNRMWRLNLYPPRVPSRFPVGGCWPNCAQDWVGTTKSWFPLFRTDKILWLFEYIFHFSSITKNNK